MLLRLTRRRFPCSGVSAVTSGENQVTDGEHAAVVLHVLANTRVQFGPPRCSAIPASALVGGLSPERQLGATPEARVVHAAPAGALSRDRPGDAPLPARHGRLQHSACGCPAGQRCHSAERGLGGHGRRWLRLDASHRAHPRLLERPVPGLLERAVPGDDGAGSGPPGAGRRLPGHDPHQHVPDRGGT